MGHNTTIGTIICWVCIWVVGIDIKHHPISAGFAPTVDGVPMQDGKLIQGFAFAFFMERQIAVVTKDMRIVSWNRRWARSVRNRMA